jgi:hypothetical protein
MCATVSFGRTFVVFRFMVLSLLQSSHPGLARAPIMWSHFPHGNEHVVTCLARLFLASCAALELIHEPRNSLLSPFLSKNSAAQVVAACFSQLSSSWSWSIQLHPQLVLYIKSQGFSSMCFDFDQQCTCTSQHSLSLSLDDQCHDICVCITSDPTRPLAGVSTTV